MKRILSLLPLILLVPLVIFLYRQIPNDKITNNAPTKSADLTASFGTTDKTTEVKVKNKDYQISFSAEKSDQTRYSRLANGIKEEIILSKPPATPFIAKYTATLSGVKPRFFQNTWHFFDDSGKEQFFIPKPFMIDQKNQRSENINLQISPVSGSRYQITLTPDHGWLTSTDRTYPVIVDPSIEIPNQPIVELLDKRNQNSKTYSLPNGSFAWEGSIGPVHYKDNPNSPQEPWKDIDLTIQPIDSQSGYGFQNLTNNFKSFFKKNSKNPDTVRYEGSGSYITFTNQDNELGALRSVEGYAEGNRFIYPDAYDNIDIKYSIGTSVLLEEFVLKKPRDISRISQKVHFEDAEYRQQQDGSISFYSTKTNELVWSFPKPKMYELNEREDENGLPSRFENFGLHYEITKDGDDYIVTKVLDQEGKDWLNSPDRVYPLVIDTTLDLQVGAANRDSGVIWWGGSSWNLGLTDREAVGYANSDYQKQGSGMGWTGVAIPNAATIDVAYITITSYYSGTGATSNSYITGEDTDNAAVWSTLADYQARRGTVVGGASDNNITTAQVAWDNLPTTWVTDTEYSSPSIVSVIQEIVNRAGWASGNALALWWDDHNGRSTAANGRHRQAYSYDTSTTKAPKLHIEYTAAATTSNIKFDGLKMEGIKVQ